MYMGNPFTFSK